jgi:nucleoside-diphosphate-sugar epimerase
VPSNYSPLGALPARFRRTRVLIIGCGDVGMRVAALLPAHVRVIALTSTLERVGVLRALGLQPVVGNLDHRASIRRLAGLATRWVHLAPPPQFGTVDARTRNLCSVARVRGFPVSVVYGSTSGVYGDCAGAWVPETQPVRAATPRALRRVDAERQLRDAGQSGLRVSILRIPGIYAPDRPQGTPRERLLQGTPVLAVQEDVYTSHIHAHDLARACIAAIWRGRPQRAYNVADDSHLKMGDYMDIAADLYGLPRPERKSREEITKQVSALRLSFMSESRRLLNHRMRNELRLILRYPTVRQGLV